MDLTLLVKALGAFFAIMNPFVNLPLFLSLTAGQEPAQQRRTAWRTTLFSALMCAVVAVSGSALLRFFGISLDDFRVAGGLVLLTIALGMLSGRGASAHEGSKTEKARAADYAVANDVAFYPMTFPIIVVPGPSPPLSSCSPRPAARRGSPPSCSPSSWCWGAGRRAALLQHHRTAHVAHAAHHYDPAHGDDPGRHRREHAGGRLVPALPRAERLKRPGHRAVRAGKPRPIGWAA